MRARIDCITAEEGSMIHISMAHMAAVLPGRKTGRLSPRVAVASRFVASYVSEEHESAFCVVSGDALDA